MSLTPEERKALYKIFADYRAAKEAIANRSVPVKRGYASAIHPDLIRASRVHPPLPKSVTGFCITPDFSDASFRRFIWRIDWHVRRLRPYRRALIRKRFLGHEPLPTDAAVYDELRREGWYVSKSFYNVEKREGLEELFRSLKLSSGAENAIKSV
ncbi:hypothetical protein GCM10025857_39570 [Alicyclobacillus contaminans]|uniref:hypothetical protein n=1 Tax=Alicyclobacillus contaminans TaxID=392016 RepID=UPI00047C624F|nr:hypothetical protein [Alicyclobacillus contaminans]GMA52600.1 hypothetical protein GCM10025857_39570 [Alicyclobacillus contaminans]